MRKPIPWTRIQIEFLSKNRKEPHAWLCKEFKRRFKKKYNDIAIRALCKRKRFLTGRTGCFPKGHKPWNTGTKGICKVNSGCFKKGNRVYNHMQVGAERFVEKNNALMVKIGEPNKWRMKRRVVWERVFGPVPKGMIIKLKDGNGRHVYPENMELITGNLHMRLNMLGYDKTPKEFQPAVRLMAEIGIKKAERK